MDSITLVTVAKFSPKKKNVASVLLSAAAEKQIRREREREILPNFEHGPLAKEFGA